MFFLISGLCGIIGGVVGAWLLNQIMVTYLRLFKPEEYKSYKTYLEEVYKVDHPIIGRLF